MLRDARFWCLLALASALSLAAGYALPRPPKKGGDLLDAVAAVQRRCPLYPTAERGLPYSWAAEGGVYLSRTSKTPAEVELLTKDPRGYDGQWDGVVYFKARARRGQAVLPFLPGSADRVLDYGDFAVYGDPKLLQEVRAVLSDQGFEAAPL
jgi:hypothetical protein